MAFSRDVAFFINCSVSSSTPLLALIRSLVLSSHSSVRNITKYDFLLWIQGSNTQGTNKIFLDHLKCCPRVLWIKHFWSLKQSTADRSTKIFTKVMEGQHNRYLALRQCETTSYITSLNKLSFSKMSVKVHDCKP